MARSEVRRPKPPAPAPKTVTAIVGTHTEKFMTKVATGSSIPSTATRSERPRTISEALEQAAGLARRALEAVQLRDPHREERADHRAVAREVDDE